MRDGETTTMAVKYVFTSDEMSDLARQMSDGLQRVDEIEGRKKSVTAQIKAELETATAEVRMVANKHRDGFEYRDTECEAKFIEENFTVELYNVETGELVSTRAMRQDERQLVLEDVVDNAGGVEAVRKSLDDDVDSIEAQ